MVNNYTILVTGGRGFAGSNFYQGSLARLASGKSQLVLHTRNEGAVHGDLADLATVQSILRDIQPRAIVHLAGRVPAASQQIEDDVFARDNTTTTRNIVRAAMALAKPPQIILASTAGVYPLRQMVVDFRHAARETVYARVNDAFDRAHRVRLWQKQAGCRVCRANV